MKIIKENPSLLCKLPKIEHTEFQVYNEIEMEKLFEIAKGSTIEFAFLLLHSMVSVDLKS